MPADAYRFDGKRALVVGGATGMGAAAAELLLDLGANVVVMDWAEVATPGVTSIHVDLRDQASIDAALVECGGEIDVVLACAGVADGTPAIERINFIGHRHLIERALANGMIRRGGAVGMISSAAGLGWEKNLPLLHEYLDTPDFDAAVAWIEAHPEKADYMWAKQAMNAYVARESFRFLRQGIRLNGIMPGPTDTPLARANAEMWLSFGADFREETGTVASTPEEQSHVLVFLCSDAASHVNGIVPLVDLGYISAGLMGSFPAATPVARALRGDEQWADPVG